MFSIGGFALSSPIGVGALQMAVCVCLILYYALRGQPMLREGVEQLRQSSRNG